MRELTEHDKQRIIDSTPADGLVLFSPALQGRGSTLIDRSQYANNGTISGATWKRAARGLPVNYFDGSDDKITVPHAASIELAAGDMTFLAWYDITDSTVAGLVDLGTKGQADLTGWGFFILVSSGCIYWQGNAAPAHRQDITAIGYLTDGQWRMYCFTRTSGVTKIYVDGADTGDVFSFFPPDSSVDNLLFGADGFYGGKFKGYRWGNRMFSRALSATEIARIFKRECHLFGV